MKKLIIITIYLCSNIALLTAQKPQTNSNVNSQSRPQTTQSRPQIIIQTNPQTNSQSRPQTTNTPSPQINNNVYTPNRVERCVLEAIYYLNSIRKEPSAYSNQIGADLGYVEARPMLKINESLMKAAQAKAEDMANRNYFGHVDPDGYGMNYRIHQAGYSIPESWYSDKTSNYVESIGCGTNMSTGKSIINLLVLDADVPSLGHRNHLLGIDEFNSTCVDIGIGHAYNANSLYKHYWSILIAKHSH